VNRSSDKSPYKFLDSYTFDDRDLFYGRERETETLVSDIISSRIVVLFAKTGTGKTSLINAGARPRLEDVDYATFYVRVEKDPVESVRRALRERSLLPESADADSLPDQLRSATVQLGKPIVLFYDQFEEFFIHFGGLRGADKVAAFIADVADVYQDRDAAVHSVFSMREEYFVEMDVFRDEIPSIFHKDSSVRLRPLDPTQAARAIREPARVLRVHIDEALPEHVARDLEEDGGVEPVRLQIVCDTLWRESNGAGMLLADYDRLGRATRIVGKRLEEDVRLLDDDQLRLFERLVPELRTVRGTKYLRGVAELGDRLEADPTLLDDLLTRLRDVHLLKESTIHQERYVEWTSDYLAERTEYLRTTARATLFGRLVSTAVAQVGATDDVSAARAAWQATEQESPTSLSRIDFDDLSNLGPEATDLERDEAAFALGTALAYGVHLRRWFDEAERRGVGVWAVVEQALRESAAVELVENAFNLLGELANDTRALALIESSLDDPALAERAFRTLELTRTADAVGVLERAIDREATTAEAIDALRRIGTAAAIDALARVVRRRNGAGVRAAIALDTIASDPAGGPRAARAQEALDGEASALLPAALRHGVETRFWFDWARDRGVDVWAVLRSSIMDADVTADQRQGALHLLGELDEDRAQELLEEATHEARLRDEARSLVAARDERARRRDAWDRLETQSRSQRRGGIDERDWDALLRRIATGECVPILGAGVTPGTLPLGSEIARGWAEEYGYPLDDAHDLARVAQYVAVRYDPMFPRETLVRQLRKSTPDLSLPDEPHSIFARLPLPLYVTTNYDHSMARALQEAGKDPTVQICRWNRSPALQALVDPDFRSSVEQPLVYHLHGHVDVPESLVLTEDDYIDFLAAVSEDQRLIPPRVRAALASSSLLFLGFTIDSWSYRVVQRGLLLRMETSLRRLSIAVQLPPDDRASDYLEAYFAANNERVYWGTAAEFTVELGRRWQPFGDGRF